MLAQTVRRLCAVAMPATLLLGLWSDRTLAGAVKVRSQIVEDLYDTYFLDANEGWAVGAFGAIYHTGDGGKHWQSQKTPTGQHLYGISFSDAKNGWAVGRSGAVIHTTDGGGNWSEQKSNTEKHLFKVDFVSPQEGWAVGDWGVMIYTADGGATWQDRSVGEDQILYAIDFVDRETGWIAGEFGSIRHTTDGGQTWVKQPIATQKTFFGVCAVTKEKAWAVGIDGLVVRTKDGGATWEIQQGQSEAASFEQLGFVEMLKNPGLYDVKVRGDKGYIVGDIGNVLVSEDGGETWTKSLLPADWRLSWIRGLSVMPSGQGMLVGASGATFVVNGKELAFSQSPM